MALEEEDRVRCIRAVSDACPGHQVREFQEQGGCSYTLLASPPDETSNLIGDDECLEGHGTSTTCTRRKPLIVQIRPAKYVLDLNIARATKATYPSLTPTIRALDLQIPRELYAYEMEKMPGTSLSRVIPKTLNLSLGMQRKQERLVRSFAEFVAQGWQFSEPQPRYPAVRADSPMEDVSEMLSRCSGKVGSSIIHRLERLSEQLPELRLRQRAESTLRQVKMSNYPVVLNHGDLIPSNILVDEDTWKITGVVDWAEAEYLPFGTCIYGLEHFLGYLAPGLQTKFESEDDSILDKLPTFTYFGHAPYLRKLFWTRLYELVPGAKTRQQDAEVMRDMGVLLWYGYAWDDGAIDRVVNESDDKVEVAYLRAFLGIV